MDQGWGLLGALVAGGEGLSPTGLSQEDFIVRLQAAVQERAWTADEINELGNRLFRIGAFERAAACYEIASQEEQAVGARVNLGRCEIRLGRPADAESRARGLVAENPRLAIAWQLLGEALAAQQRLPEAVQAAQQAAELAEGNGVLVRQWATLAEQAQDLETAVHAFERVLRLDSHDYYALRALVYYRRSICDWRELEALSMRLIQSTDAARGEVAPFDFLSEPATAAQQAACARQLAESIKQKADRRPIEPAIPLPATPGRLRVGFLSHGFGLHPTTILTMALFEQLHSSRLEVHLFSTRDDGKETSRRRLIAAAHRFHDVAGLSQRDIAKRIQAEGLDMLLDLDGYCRSRKPEVFAYRPAPLQVGWLAYPGTTGADFMDYVIADRFVIPKDLQPHFSEKVAYLPRCYQCTDPTRRVGVPPSRKACGLPESGVVYACFNASYKLNPRSVTRMLRVLAGVPGSILWLLQGPGRMADRLREVAQNMGVAPSRLIFMGKLPHHDYLARYRHVDLFLDTEDYNAHTTASDALWAGCPVLTRPGETFASRVAGSLNHHLGMAEMNVADDAAFVMKAVRYGRDADYRAGIKAKLLKQRVESGLFDIQGFARDFEGLLWRMVEHRRARKLPDAFES
jgi:predicted O-linked N-acetylglucosamine transferase (SPINDLY family)